MPHLRVTPDNMCVLLHLDVGEALDIPAVRQLLTEAGIHHGLDSGALHAAIVPHDQDRILVVARGTPPRHGSDGRVELLVREPTTVYGEGTVDLNELHHFREIDPGTPVARLIAAGKGQPGKNVLGKTVPAKDGREASFDGLLGDGLAPLDSDPSLAVATEQGIYQRFTRGGRPFLQVAKQIIVPEDIDLTVGNIDTRFPVVVNGDIRATFSVKSRQTITVRGSLEDARVSARGSLTVGGGILRGNHRVKTHGDLSARHIEGRAVKARGVHVDFGVLDSEINATGHVVAREIVGGTLLAAGSLTCDILGEPGGRQTIIQVGVDPYEEALLAWANQHEGHLDGDLLAVRERCRLLAHRVQTMISAGDDHHSEDHALREALAELADAEHLRDRCLRILADHPAHRDRAARLAELAHIEVHRRINPGTVLRIGEDAELVIAISRPGGTFRRVKGAIVEV